MRSLGIKSEQVADNQIAQLRQSFQAPPSPGSCPMNLDTLKTDLALYFEGGAEIVIPYEASVGISQSLSPIGEGSEMRRGVNGQLIVVANPLFRTTKRRSPAATPARRRSAMCGSVRRSRSTASLP